MTHPLQAFFQRIKLFSTLTGDELNELLRAIQPAQFAAGRTIFREGDPADAAYVIESGRVEILTGRGVDEVRVAELGPGDVLGELALLDGARRSAGARAVDQVSTFRIDKNEFDFLRRNLRPAAFKVIRSITGTLCDRLRETNAQIRAHLTPALLPLPPVLEEAEEAGRDDDKRKWMGKLTFWSNR
ncbi:MAG: cyclic nucleotide-binding domain-containing protein [Myxococcales bacterium]|nr:cyclic nucleotide-binding domain-containing protein [Myxococcales bacterium]